MSYKELENGQVMEVIEVKTEKQTAIVESIFDMKYNSRLRYENNQVIAEVWTYLSELATDYNGEVIFEYEGQQITANATNGIAAIDFTSDQGLEHTVKTVNEKFRNGEVTFFV